MDLSRPNSRSGAPRPGTSRCDAARPGAAFPPPAHQASSVSLAAAAAAAPALTAAGWRFNPSLLELVREQQLLMGQVEAKRAQVLPAPQFQVSAQQGTGQARPTPVQSSSSLMLGAQMSQLHLDSNRTLDRVDVLTANQMAMQANQLAMLRKLLRKRR